jgi:methyltransferase
VSSEVWFAVLVLLVAAARLVELAVARRHLRWALARGGVEHGRGHYPAMVALHAGLLLGCLVEVPAFDRPFVPAPSLQISTFSSLIPKLPSS